MSSSVRAAWCDGAIHVGEAALLSLWHPAFTRGEGVFETFRTIRGLVPGLDRHLIRLRWAAGRMGYALPPEQDYQAICKELLNAAGLEEGRFRLTLLSEEASPRLLLSVEALDLGLLARRSKGVRLLTSPFRLGERDPTRSLKLVSRSFYHLCEREILGRGGDEPLLLGDHGEIRETSRANLFAWKEGEGLLTPTLVDAFLPGVTRARLLAAVRATGLPVRERTILIGELEECREVFLTNALSFAYPVLAVDGVTFERGPILERCLQLLGKDPLQEA